MSEAASDGPLVWYEAGCEARGWVEEVTPDERADLVANLHAEGCIVVGVDAGADAAEEVWEGIKDRKRAERRISTHLLDPDEIEAMRQAVAAPAA